MSTLSLTQPERSLRARHKSATADLILQAVGRCLQDGALQDLTFARVAAEANVAERTLYRHFPTKEALLDAWWRLHQKSIGQGPYPETAAELLAAARTVFPKFDEQALLMRGSLLSPQGRAISMNANAERKKAFRRAIRDGAGDLPEPELTRLCAVVQTLYSANTWLGMRDFWDLSGEESGAVVSDAIAVLLNNARRRQRKLEKERTK
jgi:AcrR family transcriptional regulator